ncbi:MAG: RDD family protein [Deltaproteobacteria bacterium]|nr:RDD family protein [Deltaproteobacteria bacterium]
MEDYYRYGGFLQRAVAMLIDFGILMLIYLLLFLTEVFITGYAPQTRYWHWEEHSPTLLLMMIFLNMVYFTYFHCVTGQTPGKRMMALQVMTVGGGRLSVGRALLRWCGYVPSKWFFFLGFIWVLGNRKKRGWHDFIAGTVVVRLGVQPSLGDCGASDATNDGLRKR